MILLTLIALALLLTLSRLFKLLIIGGPSRAAPRYELPLAQLFMLFSLNTAAPWVIPLGSLLY
jgi:hypothetical protein